MRRTFRGTWWGIVVVGVAGGIVAGIADTLGDAIAPVARRPPISTLLDAVDNSGHNNASGTCRADRR
jgi:hypothetical protein